MINNFLQWHNISNVMLNSLQLDYKLIDTHNNDDTTLYNCDSSDQVISSINNYNIVSDIKYSHNINDRYITDKKNIIDLTHIFNAKVDTHASESFFNITDNLYNIDEIDVYINKISVTNLKYIPIDIQLHNIVTETKYIEILDYVSDMPPITITSDDVLYKVKITPEMIDYSTDIYNYIIPTLKFIVNGSIYYHITTVFAAGTVNTIPNYWITSATRRYNSNWSYINIRTIHTYSTNSTNIYRDTFDNNDIVLYQNYEYELNIRINNIDDTDKYFYIHIYNNALKNNDIINVGSYKYLLRSIYIQFIDNGVEIYNDEVYNKLNVSVMNIEKWLISINLLNSTISDDDMIFINRYGYIKFNAEGLADSSKTFSFIKKLRLNK